MTSSPFTKYGATHRFVGTNLAGGTTCYALEEFIDGAYSPRVPISNTNVVINDRHDVQRVQIINDSRIGVEYVCKGRRLKATIEILESWRWLYTFTYNGEKTIQVRVRKSIYWIY